MRVRVQGVEGHAHEGPRGSDVGGVAHETCGVRGREHRQTLRPGQGRRSQTGRQLRAKPDESRRLEQRRAKEGSEVLRAVARGEDHVPAAGERGGETLHARAQRTHPGQGIEHRD